MAFRFLDLNEDCQRLVIKHLMLDSEIKVTRIQNISGQQILKSRRLDANNEFRLTNKHIYGLFEDEVDRFRVYDLRSNGDDLKADLATWSHALGLKDVRYLRLILDFSRSARLAPRPPFGPFGTFGHLLSDAEAGLGNWIMEKLVELPTVLTNFPNLKDLEMFVLVNTTLAAREYLLHSFAKTVSAPKTLRTIHTRYSTLIRGAAFRS